MCQGRNPTRLRRRHSLSRSSERPVPPLMSQGAGQSHVEYRSLLPDGQCQLDQCWAECPPSCWTTTSSRHDAHNASPNVTTRQGQTRVLVPLTVAVAAAAVAAVRAEPALEVAIATVAGTSERSGRDPLSSRHTSKPRPKRGAPRARQSQEGAALPLQSTCRRRFGSPNAGRTTQLRVRIRRFRQSLSLHDRGQDSSHARDRARARVRVPGRGVARNLGEPTAV